MREEHRQFGRRQDVAGGAAEDHLPQTALRIGAFDQQIGADRGGLGENGFARP